MAANLDLCGTCGTRHCHRCPGAWAACRRVTSGIAYSTGYAAGMVARRAGMRWRWTP